MERLKQRWKPANIMDIASSLESVASDFSAEPIILWLLTYLRFGDWRHEFTSSKVTWKWTTLVMRFALECFGFPCNTNCTNRLSQHQTRIDETLAKSMSNVVTIIVFRARRALYQYLHFAILYSALIGSVGSAGRDPHVGILILKTSITSFYRKQWATSAAK